MIKEYTMAKRIVSKKDGSWYIKFCYVNKKGQFVKFLSKKELKTEANQWRENIIKNIDTVFDNMADGKSLGEALEDMVLEKG
jgi:Tol biopolymer transport system component